MNIIKRLRRWYWGDQLVELAIRESKGKAGYTLNGKEIKSYWVYGPDICPENGYKNHVKSDVPMMFGYCCIPGVPNTTDALYHCKYCQQVMHFPLHKNTDEKDLYEKRKIETNNFRKPINLTEEEFMKREDDKTCFNCGWGKEFHKSRDIKQTTCCGRFKKK